MLALALFVCLGCLPLQARAQYIFPSIGASLVAGCNSSAYFPSVAAALDSCTNAYLGDSNLGSPPADCEYSYFNLGPVQSYIEDSPDGNGGDATYTCVVTPPVYVNFPFNQFGGHCDYLQYVSPSAAVAGYLNGDGGCLTPGQYSVVGTVAVSGNESAECNAVNSSSFNDEVDQCQRGGAYCNATSPVYCIAPGSAPLQPPKSLGASNATQSPDGDCGCSKDYSAIPSSTGQVTSGDPIDIGSGNVFYRFTDYQTAGPNKLSFGRFYNSRSTLAPTGSFPTILGAGWRSNYDRYLRNAGSQAESSTVITNGYTIYAERAGGEVLAFTWNGTNYVADSDVGLTLTLDGSNWSLTDGNDTVETYALGPNPQSPALLKSIVLRDGYTQTLNYNASNQRTSVTDSYGRSLVFAYTGSLLQSVTTPDGLIISFGYNASGLSGGASDRLASVTYSTSPATSKNYLYENAAWPFALTGIIDERNVRSATWVYDEYSRGLSSQLGTGANLTSVTYNDTDGSRVVTNALGEQDSYRFATIDNMPKVIQISRQATGTVAAATRNFTYDADGYLASATDWNGSLTTYVNDARGEPTSITEASGTPIARTTNVTYLPNYHLPSQIVAPGVTTNFSYDASGNLLSRTQTDTSGANAGNRSWSYSWSNALLTSVTGPRGDVTTLAYSTSGALTSIRNALGQTIKIASHTGGGYPKIIDDPNGVSTVLSYYPRLWVENSVTTTPNGRRVTSFTYDATGNLTRDELPDGSFLAYTYDTADRLTSVADRLGEGIAFTLDALGDPTGITIGKGSAANWTDAGTFDMLGRNILDQRGEGEQVATTYDSNGNALTSTDALSRTRTEVYDALNRVVQIVDPAKGTTGITYNAQDRVTAVTAPNGAVTSYAYDGFGRLLQRTSPDTGVTTYAYDAEDNLLSSQDAAGVVTNHTYDALSRITSTTYPADASENVAYTYDQKGYGYSIGHLTSVADAAGTLSYTYDALGNTLGETRASGGVTLSTAYTYDAANRIASLGYPSGTVAAYTHNLAGQVVGINVVLPGATAATALISGVSYKPFGPVTSLTYGNGIAETRSYDTAYRLTRVVTGSDVQSLTYHYNTADDVLAVADSVNKPNSQTFGYDLLDRLTAAKGAYGSLGWSYDAAGNVLTQAQSGIGTTKYSYATASNLLASLTLNSTTTQVTTSPSGNTLAITPSSGNASNFTFNQAERLAAVTVGGNPVASYTYDAFGRRFSKTLPKSQSLFQYGLSRELLEEANGTGGLVTDTIYLNGAPVADVTPNGSYFLHTDHLGTPQVATTTQQAVAWRAAYRPFGFNSGAAGLLTQNIRFPGQYANAENGFYQNGFRDYSPAWARYLESDPIGLAGGINTFLYANGNALSNVDFTGLVPWNLNGKGNTNVCAYYDARTCVSNPPMNGYYNEAGDICRGGNIFANSALDAGIIYAWIAGTTNDSEADIYNEIRSGLISSDQSLVAQFGPNGVTGSMIDAYHNKVFNQVGIPSGFYGGNIIPQGFPLNPVPFDPTTHSVYDPRQFFH